MAGDSIWLDEDSRYNRPGHAYPAWMSASDAARLEHIRQARMLFDGRHRALYLDEGRTQFAFRQVRTNDGDIKTLYVTTNLLKLVAMKAADLLFGAVPLLSSDQPDMDAEIAALAERCGLHQVCYQAAIDASVEGDACLEAVVFDGDVYLQQVPGNEVFPQGRLLPDGQFATYVRRTMDCTGQGATERKLMLESTYTAGQIERHAFDVSRGMRLEVGLDQWPAYAATGARTPAPVERTGIAWNTLVWIPNLMVRRRAVSDFDGVVELQDVLNAKSSQLAVVILKHAQPKLLVPEQAFDEQGQLRDAEVLVKREGESAEYLTWDAQLAAAQEDRKFTVTQLLVQTETAPALLGLNDAAAAPDAFRKVKLASFNSLAKAARRAVYWAQGVKTALTTALMLQGTIPGHYYTDSQISVQLRDGIPPDELDEANRLSILLSAGIVDDQWCLEQLLADPGEVDAILERKAAKAAAAAPSVFFGEPAAADAAAPPAEAGAPPAATEPPAVAPGPAPADEAITQGAAA